MSKKYSVAVVIGRFQPVHNAHLEIIKQAAEQAKKVVIVIGSADRPRTFENPWFAREREALLTAVTQEIYANTIMLASDATKFVFEHNPDTIYNNDAWLLRVQRLVGKHTKDGDKVVLIGHKKAIEETGEYDYLNQFKQWDFIDHGLVENLHATQIRQLYFSPEVNFNWFKGVLPQSVVNYLRIFKDSPEYASVVRDKEFIEKYKKQASVYPYPITYVTADAVVFQAGHVLMVKRGADPGHGLWALPGGFIKNVADKEGPPDQTMEDAAIRELYEETKIKVAEKILRGSIIGEHVFSALKRSARGRTITHAFNIGLDDGEYNLPKVKGSDDAKHAEWIPFSKLKGEEIFEDHLDIIHWFLGRK